LVQSLAENLKGIGDDFLETFANKLQVASQPWFGPDHRTKLLRSIAVQLLGAVAKQPGLYADLTDLFNELKRSSLEGEKLRKILRYCSPYWVPCEAVATLQALLTLVSGPEGRCGSPIVNGRRFSDYISTMYLNRAFPLRFNFCIREITEASAGNYVDECARQICDHYRELRNVKDADSLVVQALKVKAPWLFIRLPPPPDAAAFDALRTMFPNLVFMVFTEERLDEVKALQGSARLEPELDLDRVFERRDDFNAVANMID
jgi:hypothetical protein